MAHNTIILMKNYKAHSKIKISENLVQNLSVKYSIHNDV